jgi:hypothetical protein
MKKATTTKQTASEKRLFAEITALDHRVTELTAELYEHMEMMDALANTRVLHDAVQQLSRTLSEQNKRISALEQPLSPTQEAYLKAWRVMHDPEHKDKTAKQIWGLLNDDSKPDPKKYVLTDADWQRVIDEKFLCEFGDDGITYPTTSTLEARRRCFVQSNGGLSIYCRPLNKPGVMQPYFGQGMPVHASTRVLIKLRSGLHSVMTAKDVEWDIDNTVGDVVAFTVLE